MKVANFVNFIKNFSENQSTKVILIYGTDENLILEKIHEIKISLKDYIYTTIEQNENYLSDLSNEMLTTSIFGEKKLIALHNFRKLDGKKITDILSKIDNNNNNILILSHPTTIEAANSIRKLCETEKHFASIGIYAENDYAIKQIATEILQKMQLEYEQDVPDFLSQMFSGNSASMKQEIEKLQIYLLLSPQKITKNLLLNVINSSQDYNIFDLPIHLFNKNTKKAIEIIENAQNQDESPVAVFVGISLYIKKLYLVKQEILKANGGDISIILKKNGVFFNQENDFKKHVNSLHINEMIKILENLNNLEISTRNSATMAYNNIKNFAINLCQG